MAWRLRLALVEKELREDGLTEAGVAMDGVFQAFQADYTRLAKKRADLR